MDAEKMFAELGYENSSDTTLDNGIRIIIYRKRNLEDNRNERIEFVSACGNVCYDADYEYWDEERRQLIYGGLVLTSDEFKAIVQQMRELGIEV